MTHRMKNCSLREMGNVLTEFCKQATRPTAMQVKSDGHYCNQLHIVCRVVHCINLLDGAESFIS